MISESNDQLIANISIHEFFQESVQNALTNQQLSICDETVVYLTNLLTAFIHSNSLFDHTPDGIMIKPLAYMYGDALQAPTSKDRDMALQRLGDVALFISGLYAASLNRSLVDVDYYIAMGGNAYGYLADSSRISRQYQSLQEVFAELAVRFDKLVDVLAEVGEIANVNNNYDVLRLYEIWLCTGSKRAAGKLNELGIHPVSTQRRQH